MMKIPILGNIFPLNSSGEHFGSTQNVALAGTFCPPKLKKKCSFDDSSVCCNLRILGNIIELHFWFKECACHFSLCVCHVFDPPKKQA